MFQVLGLLLILASISGTFWWITRHTKATGAVITAVLALCLFAVFSGVALILEERITKVIIPRVGTIEAVTQQATTDAKTISDLKARVENQSATVDLVAKQASSAKALSEQVEEQNKLAAQKLDTLNKAIQQANSVLSDLKSEAEFTQTVVAAENDDRSAFDKLEKLAGDQRGPFSERARQAWTTIFNQHTQAIYNSNFTIPWRDGLDPAKLSLPQLVEVYAAAPTWLKPALLEYISNRSDIPKANASIS